MTDAVLGILSLGELAVSRSLGFRLAKGYSCRIGNQTLTLGGGPPTAALGGLGVLFRGRLFNAVELSRALEVEPRGNSALLLHAFRKWGAGFPRQLQGEYAFAAWDGDAGRLLLGRDTTGSLPLHYMKRGDEFAFSDTIQSILALMGERPRLNERRIADWLAHSPQYQTQTFVDGILSVQPGTTVLYENGLIRIDDFWRPEQTPPLKSRDGREYAEGLFEVLDEAVQDRMAASSFVGSHLSGGLDSSSVTVAAARLLAEQGRRIFAFTAVPEHPVEIPGRFTDESQHAAAIATMYPNIDHVLVRHGAHSAFSLIDLFNSTQEEPVLNPFNYDWIYEICREARLRGVDTMLIGQSGNFSISYAGDRALTSLLRAGRLEAFGRLARDLHRNGSRRWLAIAHELLRPWMPVTARYFFDRLRGGRSTAMHEYTMIRREFARDHDLGLMTLEAAHLREDSRKLRIRFLRRPDFGMLNAPLHRLTRVAMTDPTFDRRVVEYCLSVPVEYFCENGVPRSLIRNAMEGRLPEMVRTERRKGLQAADFGIHFEAERQEALAEVERLKQVDLAARALDLPAMEALLRMSPAQIAEHGGMLGFLPRLMRGLSLGRFIRRYEDGTLFSTPEVPADSSPSLSPDFR